MTQLTLDENLARQFDNVGEVIELRDPEGRILGHFVPVSAPGEWETVSPDVSEAELDRRERAGETRFTTAEVLAHLEKL